MGSDPGVRPQTPNSAQTKLINDPRDCFCPCLGRVRSSLDIEGGTCCSSYCMEKRTRKLSLELVYLRDTTLAFCRCLAHPRLPMVGNMTLYSSIEMILNSVRPAGRLTPTVSPTRALKIAIPSSELEVTSM